MNSTPWTVAFFCVFCIVVRTTAAAERIKVPFDAHYEPMSFRAENGGPEGFDVEVAKAIAAESGIEIDFEAADFFDIQVGNWPSDWGYTVASMSRDSEREKRFDFIGPYLFDTVVVVTREMNSVSLVEELIDVDIGVCSGCVYEDFLRGLAKGLDGQPILGARPVQFMTDPDIIREVANPKSDLSYGVTSVFHADYYIALGAPIKKLDPPLFASPLWIAVPKGNPELRDKIKMAFDVIENSGALKDLSHAFLGNDYTRID